MQAEIFINTCDERTVPKDLTPATDSEGNRIGEFTLNFLDASDIIHPVVKMTADRLDGAVNYMYLKSLGRFYFIRKWTMDQGYVVPELEEDVLESWKEKLLETEVVVNRNEEHHNNYLIDDKAKAYGYKAVKTIKFPAGFNADVQEFVMGVIGSTT